MFKKLAALFAPLKFRAAIVTVLASTAAAFGFDVDEEIVIAALALATMVFASLGATKAEDRAPEKGSTTLDLLFVVVAFVASGTVACAWLKGEAQAVRKDLVDCTTAQADKLEQQFGPVIDELLVLAAGGDGKVDWDHVKSATKSFAFDTGGCVLAAAVSRALKPPAPPAPGAPQSSPLLLDPDSLRAGWEEIRAELGGATYKLRDGTL